MRVLTLAVVMATMLAITPTVASASPTGVGLGVAAGADVSKQGNVDTKTNFSWSFFVDIPLLQTFYITPQTSLYELQLSDATSAKVAVTDVDLNFKFLVPLGFATLGAGLTAGLTTGLGEHYKGHYGALGIFSLNLVANLDAFAMVQWKRVSASKTDAFDDIDNIHGYVGGMWKF
jgi:hypothetical protein